MSNDLIAGAVLVLVSLPLFAMFGHFERKHRRLVSHGRQARGTCRRSSASHSGTGGVVHFVDHQGTYHKLIFMASAPAPNGAEVTVFYDPDAARVAVVAEARFNHFGWLAAALLTFGAGANWLVGGFSAAS